VTDSSECRISSAFGVALYSGKLKAAKILKPEQQPVSTHYEYYRLVCTKSRTAEIFHSAFSFLKTNGFYSKTFSGEDHLVVWLLEKRHINIAHILIDNGGILEEKDLINAVAASLKYRSLLKQTDQITIKLMIALLEKYQFSRSLKKDIKRVVKAIEDKLPKEFSYYGDLCPYTSKQQLERVLEVAKNYHIIQKSSSVFTKKIKLLISQYMSNSKEPKEFFVVGPGPCVIS